MSDVAGFRNACWRSIIFFFNLAALNTQVTCHVIESDIESFDDRLRHDTLPPIYKWSLEVCSDLRANR